jgi:hemolysin activation/secretion protein
MALMVGAAAGRRQAEMAQQQQMQQQQAQQAAYEQGKQEAVQPAPAPAPAPAAPSTNVTAELQKLAELHNSGVLSDEEFAAAKKKLLG